MLAFYAVLFVALDFIFSSHFVGPASPLRSEYSWDGCGGGITSCSPSGFSLRFDFSPHPFDVGKLRGLK